MLSLKLKRASALLLICGVLGAVGCDKPAAQNNTKPDAVPAEPVADTTKEPAAATAPSEVKDAFIFGKDKMSGPLTKNCDADALKAKGFKTGQGDVSGLSSAGGELVISFKHAGGCGAHEYIVCWDGAIAESDPGQTAVEFWHNDHGDMCEALLSGELKVKADELYGLSVSVRSLSGVSVMHEKAQ